MNVAVDDAIVAAGDLCHVDQLYQEFNVLGTNPLDQLSIIVNSLLQQRPSFHVLVSNEMADLTIVDNHGVLIFIHSHVHGTNGALIARSTPEDSSQAHWFSLWLNSMLTQTYGVGMSICSISYVC